MQRSEKLKVVELNSLLTCVLCRGYYIDATTISECLHSFCRTCIVSYLQTNKYCPICEVQVHKTRPLLSIRSDQTLQDIVYKIVPDLFKSEMKRRFHFYMEQGDLGEVPVSSEKRGDVVGCERLIFTPEDTISISLEYCPKNFSYPVRWPSEHRNNSVSFIPNDAVPKNKNHRRYFQCPGAVTVLHLKKLLRMKYGLASDHKVDILYVHDHLRDEYTLIDLAYIYSWRRNGPMRLFYNIHMKTCESLVAREVCIVTDSTPVPSTNSPLRNIQSYPEVPVTSPDPNVAAAPTQTALARHPSPPRSPQMAAEPDHIKIDGPVCPAVPEQTLNGIHQDKNQSVSPKFIKNQMVPNLPEISARDSDSPIFEDEHKNSNVNSIVRSHLSQAIPRTDGKRSPYKSKLINGHFPSILPLEEFPSKRIKSNNYTEVKALRKKDSQIMMSAEKLRKDCRRFVRKNSL